MNNLSNGGMFKNLESQEEVRPSSKKMIHFNNMTKLEPVSFEATKTIWTSLKELKETDGNLMKSFDEDYMVEKYCEAYGINGSVEEIKLKSSKVVTYLKIKNVNSNCPLDLIIESPLISDGTTIKYGDTDAVLGIPVYSGNNVYNLEYNTKIKNSLKNEENRKNFKVLAPYNEVTVFEEGTNYKPEKSSYKMEAVGLVESHPLIKIMNEFNHFFKFKEEDITKDPKSKLVTVSHNSINTFINPYVIKLKNELGLVSGPHAYICLMRADGKEWTDFSDLGIDKTDTNSIEKMAEERIKIDIVYCIDLVVMHNGFLQK